MAVSQGSWSDPVRSPEQRDILRDRLQQRIAEFKREKPNPPPKDAFKDITNKLNQKLEKAVNDAVRDVTGSGGEPSRDEAEAAVARGETLQWDGDSECFASLEYTDGILDAVFTSGHAYSAPLDVETAIDFLSADSVGKFYNRELSGIFDTTKSKNKGK